MNTTDILSMSPGPALDEAIRLHVFQQSGHEPAPAFSTDAAAGASLLEKLPLFVARVERPKDPLKPWLAGTLATNLDSSVWHTTMTVTGSTMLGVLCRAALLVATKAPPPAKSEAAPAAETTPPPQRPTGLGKRAPAGTKTPPGAPVPAKAKGSVAPAVRQPIIFLNARTKLPPIPKRKPFVMPGDIPAK